MTQQHCFRCQVGDIGVSVVSERKATIDELAEIYRAYPHPAAEGEPALCIEVVRTGGGFPAPKRYQILGDGRPIGSEHRADELVPFLEWAINWQVITTCSQYLQVHAATLSRSGRGVVLAGGPGSGKSTLAAGLLSRGWRYLSDEFALIDPTTLRLHPFPKPLCIKSGSFGVLQRLGVPFARRRDFVKGAKGRVGYVNPLDISPEAISGPCPIESVIFPTYTEGVPTRFEPISRSRALLDLSTCSFNRHVFGDDSIEILERALGQAACYRLESSSLEEACGCVESLLASPETLPIEATPSETACQPEHRARRADPKPGKAFGRRSFLRRAVKVGYVLPAVAALKPQTVFAAASGPFSCYPKDHACPGNEPCCNGLTCKNSVCAGPCGDPGELCFVDSDCCSGKCNLGSCE